MAEKKGRMSREEVNKLAEEAKHLIDGGMGKIEAAEKVGISYPSLVSRLGGSAGGNDLVKSLERAKEAISEALSAAKKNDKKNAKMSEAIKLVKSLKSL